MLSQKLIPARGLKLAQGLQLESVEIQLSQKLIPARGLKQLHLAKAELGHVVFPKS